MFSELSVSERACLLDGNLPIPDELRRLYLAKGVFHGFAFTEEHIGLWEPSVVRECWNSQRSWPSDTLIAVGTIDDYDYIVIDYANVAHPVFRLDPIDPAIRFRRLSSSFAKWVKKYLGVSDL